MMRIKILLLFAFVVSAAIILQQYYTRVSNLHNTAVSVIEMHQKLPNHFKIAAATSRIQDDKDMGCWIALAHVLPDVEIFYSDDDKLLHHKLLPIHIIAAWLKQQIGLELWVWDWQMSLKDHGRFFKVLEIEDHALQQNELYLHVMGKHCHFHEGQMVSIYGEMTPDVMNSLLFNTDQNPDCVDDNQDGCLKKT